MLHYAPSGIELIMIQMPLHSDCSLIRLDRFEYHVREELNKVAARAMVVLNPLKVNLPLSFLWAVTIILDLDILLYQLKQFLFFYY